MKSRYILTLITISIIAVSCEDVVFPELEPAPPIYVVDAWINNRQEPQVVRLMRTQPYFDNSIPPGVAGASVTIEDDLGNTFAFAESAAGSYVWTPPVNGSFGEAGRTYTLTIVTSTGETLTSETRMNPVPVVDSITFNKQQGNSFVDDLYFGEFWGTDLAPVGDAYWIKTYKNGQLLNRPSDLNLAYDAAFARGSDFSGVAFITPIRTGINAFDEAEDGSILSPLALGDSIYVEINSLSDASFDFLTEVMIQTDRPGGFGELFATPLANVSTNLKNQNPNGTAVVGFFNVASVSGNGRRFKSYDEISRTF